MPAPKDKPHLHLQHHVTGVAERGAVIHPDAVPDPAWLVSAGAALWTGEPVTVDAPKVGAPPTDAERHIEAATELAEVRRQAAEVGEENVRLKDAKEQAEKSLAAAKADADAEVAKLKAELDKAHRAAKGGK